MHEHEMYVTMEVRDTGFLADVVQGVVSHQVLETRANLDLLQKHIVLLTPQPYVKLPLCYFYSMLKSGNSP